MQTPTSSYPTSSPRPLTLIDSADQHTANWTFDRAQLPRFNRFAAFARSTRRESHLVKHKSRSYGGHQTFWWRIAFRYPWCLQRIAIVFRPSLKHLLIGSHLNWDPRIYPEFHSQFSCTQIRIPLTASSQHHLHTTNISLLFEVTNLPVAV
mgnify:CR=1 FL=1